MAGYQTAKSGPATGVDSLTTSDLYIGLMSGTSLDGIDAVLAEFPGDRCVIHSHQHRAYPPDLRAFLGRVTRDPGRATLPDIATLDVLIAEQFAAAAQSVLSAGTTTPHTVRAIGSHGQTVFHAPDAAARTTIQLGDPALIAVRTGIAVVGDFRRGDMALAGQGAPLVPAFHRYAFQAANESRAVVNIGGIANISLLRPGAPLTAFDTGPGNTLLDAWCAEHTGAAYDSEGRYAASGTVHQALLASLLDDQYFQRKPPKSTGVDYFGPAWLTARLANLAAPPESPMDIQATLAELTAASIAAALPGDAGLAAVAVCGGGAHNLDLLQRLRRRLPRSTVCTTADWGIAPGLVEATAFAWLARERLEARPSNVPEVTGATALLSMGGVYLPPQSR